MTGRDCCAQPFVVFRRSEGYTLAVAAAVAVAVAVAGCLVSLHLT